MSASFCTACGCRMSSGSVFCEECGVCLSNGVASDIDKTPQTSIHPRPSTWVTWLDVGGKSLALGVPLVVIFDFLSPRVVLLPVAATVAVIGMLLAVALRRLVAPRLPNDSKLLLILAPGSGLHKSPLVIGAAVVSALMVSGAAWSSANSAEGGIIASKFDGTRVVQMQVGILQNMQKEQRQQSAILEDMREGRAADPRRELNNIGAGFNSYELDAALERADARTVRLLLAGGLKWRVPNAYLVFSGNNADMAALLQENMSNFELRDGDCEILIEQKLVVSDLGSNLIQMIQTENSLPTKKSAELASFQKAFMKKFCSNDATKIFLKNKIYTEQQKIAEFNSLALQAQSRSIQSRKICISNYIAKRPDKINMERIHKKYRKGERTCILSDCSYSDDRLAAVLGDEKAYARVAQDLCHEEFPIVESASKENTDFSPIYQQVLNAID